MRHPCSETRGWAGECEECFGIRRLAHVDADNAYHRGIGVGIIEQRSGLVEITDYTLESEGLQKSLDVAVYGSAGRPVIVFPEGDSSCTSWENGGMVEALSALVDSGAVQLFCTDSVDDGGWYSRFALSDYRIDNISGYFGFVEDVLVPFVAEHASTQDLPLVAGAGMGALNATIAILRRPDLFGGLLALSGSYDVRVFAGDDFDEQWAEFSPVDILAQPSCDALVGRPLAFVCGQGADETGIGSQRALEGLLADKDIEATFEYWGFDVGHDWSWWQEEARQILPCLLVTDGLLDRRLSARAAIATAAADHAAEVLRASQDELSAANAAIRAARAKAKSTAARVGTEEAVVEKRKDVEARLAEAARVAWAKRGEVAALLAEAEEKARAAQDAADAAARDRASAEWIAGEARAAAARALTDRSAANGRVSAAKAAVKEATADVDKAVAALGALSPETSSEVAPR